MSIDELFQALHLMPLEQAASLALVGNVAIFVTALGFGEWLVRRYRHKANAPPPEPISREEVALSLVCVVLNWLVAVVGLWLWQVSLLSLRPNNGPLAIVDVAGLVMAMDFGMYVFHRVAHHPWLYPLIHRTHHRYENPRPLTLFVLNPMEVAGFGALLIAVIWAWQPSPVGILIYLTFNLVFGVVGHLGVEPASKAWWRNPILRSIATSTFHAEHHRDRGHNFGFYTVVWDRWLGTLSPDYHRDFLHANRGE